MNSLIQTSLSFRTFLAQNLEKVDEKQLDIVAPKFKNTIRWQLAHLVVTPTLLTYKKVGSNSPLLSDEFLKSTCKGTSHENFSLNEDYSTRHLLEFLVETTKQLERDYKDLKKMNYQAYETSTGFMIKDLDTALAYSNIHDGIHIGNIRAVLTVLG